jgi:ubiquitin-like-conjugating enzyme ATG10
MATSTYSHYPFLDMEEFAEVCHLLESKYCRATLGPRRQKWRLHTCRALDVSLASNLEYTTFVQITRPLDDTQDLGDLAVSLEAFSMHDDKAEDTTTDEKMAGVDVTDEVSGLNTVD